MGGPALRRTESGTRRTRAPREWRACWTPHAWSEALAASIEEAALLQRIRQATRTGRPVGSPDFVHYAEAILGRKLAPGKPGRKPTASSKLAIA